MIKKKTIRSLRKKMVSLILVLSLILVGNFSFLWSDTHSISESQLKQLNEHLDKLNKFPEGIPLFLQSLIASTYFDYFKNDLKIDLSLPDVQNQLRKAIGLTDLGATQYWMQRHKYNYEKALAEINTKMGNTVEEIKHNLPNDTRFNHQKLLQHIQIKAMEVFGNPIHKGMDDIFDAVLDYSVARILKNATKDELKGFTEIHFDEDQANIMNKIEEAKGFLKDKAKEELNALHLKEQVLIAQSLQIKVKEILSTDGVKLQEQLNHIGSIPPVTAEEAKKTLNLVKDTVQKSFQFSELENKFVNSIQNETKIWSNQMKELSDIIENVQDTFSKPDLDKLNSYFDGNMENLIMENIRNNVKTYFNSGLEQFFNFKKLLSDSGINLNNFEGLEKNLLQNGNILENMGKNLLSNSYAGIASTLVGGIVNGLNASGEAKSHHEEIMNQFSKVNIKLDEIAGTVGTILDRVTVIEELQKQIIDGQKQILREIKDLEEKMVQSFEKVYEKQDIILEKIYDLYDLVLGIARIQKDYIWDEFQSCINISKLMNLKKKIPLNQLSNNYAPFHYNFPDWLTDRLESKLIRDNGTFHSFFVLDSVDQINNSDSLRLYREKVVKPFFDYFRRTPVDKQQELFSYLQNSSFLSDSLDKKKDYNKNGNDFKNYFFRYFRTETNFTNYSRVIAFADVILKIHPLIQLVDYRRGEILSQEALMNPQTFRTTPYTSNKDRAINLLWNTLELVNFSIAQHTLFSGDILLSQMVQDLENQNIEAVNIIKNMLFPPTDLKNNIPEKEDNLLAQNLLVYLLHSRIKGPTPDISYATGLNLENASFLEGLTEIINLSKGGIDFKYIRCTVGNKTKWTLQIKDSTNDINKINLTLPTVEEFKAGKFHISYKVKRLLEIREQLVEEIASYNVEHEKNLMMKFSILLKMAELSDSKKAESSNE